MKSFNRCSNCEVLNIPKGRGSSSHEHLCVWGGGGFGSVVFGLKEMRNAGHAR